MSGIVWHIVSLFLCFGSQLPTVSVAASVDIDATAQPERVSIGTSMLRRERVAADGRDDKPHPRHGLVHSHEPHKAAGEAAHKDKKPSAHASEAEKTAAEPADAEQTRATAAADAGKVELLKAASQSAAGDKVAQAAKAKEDEAQRIAKEVESMHLVDSEIDPDAAAKKHVHEAFQVKVTGPSGHEMCLSEQRHGYHVGALKCADHHGQQWYWDGKQIKNLNSEDRCLGYAIHSHNRHDLAMYTCNDDSMWTAWIMDDQGRLKSEEGGECMAFEERDTHQNAVTLPCEEQ